MQIGVTGNSASYKQYINIIFYQYPNDFYQVYVDGIFIYSKSRQQQ